MPSTQVLHAPPTPSSLPIPMPGKSPYYPPPLHQGPYTRTVMSPPPPGSSVNTSAVPSLTSGSYPGSSTGDGDSSHGGAPGVDLIEMLNDRLSNAVDTLPLDRSLARQAQTWATPIPVPLLRAKDTDQNQFRGAKRKAPGATRTSSSCTTSSQKHPCQFRRWRASRQRSEAGPGLDSKASLVSPSHTLVIFSIIFPAFVRRSSTDMVNSTLKTKAERRYPVEYRAANERFPTSIDY